MNITPQEIAETLAMVSEQNLDLRTITMGISLNSCADENLDRMCQKVYDRITRQAEHLVSVAEDLEREYGIPIANKRVSVTPIAQIAACTSAQDLTPLPTQNIPSEVVGFVSAINLLLDKAGRFMQQQKRFIADASHELRSPMTALSLQVENLQQLPLSDEAKAQVAQIQQGIQRNRHLLEQLLSLARLQNTSGAERHWVDVNAVFRQVIEAVLPLAGDKDIGVVSSANVNVMGEEMDFYLLIKTLVDNAVSYTPVGSQIDLSAEETENAWLIHVEDNGCGISAAERERVLEPFYRILGTRQQGSGLGLSIAQEIVRKYHGSLQLCDSRHFEHGLWVRIELPKT